MGNLTIGSLFSGIGGLELGLEWAGLGRTVWQCEGDPFCRKVLAKHWPDMPCYEDVTALRNPPTVDLICGGFPCQDLSHTGLRKGINDGKRSRLWWEFSRLVGEVQPGIVVVENRTLDRPLREKALGNCVVPQVSMVIGLFLREMILSIPA